MPEKLAADCHHILVHTRDLWEEFRDSRIFLTGGTGFVGCWLLEGFTHAADELSLKAQIHVLTRNPDAFARKAPRLAAHPAVCLLSGDIRTFAFPDGSFSHVIHGATEVAGTLQNDQPQIMLETIVRGAERVLEFAGRHDEAKSLLISSGAVYGIQPHSVSHMPEDEEAFSRPLVRPSSYAEGKREAEKLWKDAGPIARGFAFAGPYLPLGAHFAIGNFIRDALAGGPIRVTGDGTPRRSYLYGADLAVWLWTILARGTSGKPYNVGSENDHSIADIAREVSRCVDSHPSVVISGVPGPGSTPERYVPSTERARTELGLHELVALDEAIRRTAEWYSTKPVPPVS